MIINICFRLIGVIHYHSSHFVAYVLRLNNQWQLFDDLHDAITTVSPNTPIKPMMALYLKK